MFQLSSFVRGANVSRPGGPPRGGFAAACFLLACASSAPAAPPCERSPSLADVLERVEASPRVAAAASETEAQRELVRQAGARPNPDLRLEVEDFTGSGAYSDFGESQTTLSFTQKLELGGVRGRRIDAASRDGDAVAARGEAERAQAVATARQRFVDLTSGAAGLAAARDAERLSRTLLADAERRGAGAAASEADVARVRIAAAKATLDADDRKRDVAIAAGRLVASWGGSADETACYEDASVRGRLSLPAVPRGKVASADVSRAPAVAAADAEVEAMRAEVALARASAAPDLEVGAGVRHLAGPDDVSAVAELRVELPLFDRNEGAIASAERKLTASQSRALAVRRETEAKAVRLRESLEAAAAREHAIATQMMPSAESAAASLERAWQSGAASTFEMIEARRAVLELKQQRIDAASEYWRTFAALEALTGTATSAPAGQAATTED